MVSNVPSQEVLNRLKTGEEIIDTYETYYFSSEIFQSELFYLGKMCLMAKIKLRYPFDKLKSQYAENYKMFDQLVHFSVSRIVELKYLIKLSKGTEFEKFLKNEM